MLLRSYCLFFEQFPTQYLSGERNIKLAYRHLVQPESAVRKLMILVNGRAENMLKWTELAYDFYQQGYDVLLFDHRGQGYSQRIIPQKGHLDEFRFYTDDMAKIIEKTTALFTCSHVVQLVAPKYSNRYKDLYLTNRRKQCQ